MLGVLVGALLGVLAELMSRRLDEVRLAVLMLDAIARTGRTNAGGARDHLRRGGGAARPLRGT